MYLIEKKLLGKSIKKYLFTNASIFKGNDGKFHYIYKINIPYTNMEYIGVRTHFDWTKDKYVGSSLHLFYKQDIIMSKEIKFEILSFHGSRKEAELREIEIVDKQYIKRKDTYNISIPKLGWNRCGSMVVRCLKTGKSGTIKCEDYSSLKNDFVSVNGKEVYQYSKEGIFITKFNSCKEASKKLNLSNSIIGQCAKGNKYPHVGGFIWLYEDNLTDLEKRIEKLKNTKTIYNRKVHQYDLNGELINIFSTLKSAIDKFNNNSIGKCCRGDINYRHVCGFIWLYENNLDDLKNRVTEISKNNLSGKNKPVYQFTLSGDFLCEYNSYQDAKNKSGFGSGISQSCLGNYKQSNGFIWLYNKSEISKRLSDILY